MFSKSNAVAQAQMAELRFQAAVIEPTKQCTASRPSETTSGEDRKIDPKTDLRTADEIYGTNGPVTAKSHPHTFSVQFQEHGLAMDADFIGVRSFQNCLERFISKEALQKQRSAHRSADTLRRIVEKNPIPPPHYPRDNAQVCANWRLELKTKWVTYNRRAYKAINGNAEASCKHRPETPTEEWYAMLAKIHHDHGHHGRDEVFKTIRLITPSISKSFVAAYVSCCCLRGKTSTRKVNVRETFAGEELAKTGKHSKGKKRAIKEADPDSPSPAAKRPNSTEPAMVNAADEQDRSLRNDYSPPQMGVEAPNAMADLFQLGAEDWQGDDGDYSANRDNTSHPQLQDDYDPGLSIDFEEPSFDIHGNISDEEFGRLVTGMYL